MFRNQFYSMKLTLLYLFVFSNLVLFDNVYCHVRLTFPPARTYAVDFLDNGRTTGPCGMNPYPGEYCKHC